jgi:N-acetylmuramoyl-L-alanine amidase
MRHYLGIALVIIFFAVSLSFINYSDGIKYVSKAVDFVGSQLAALVTYNPKSAAYLKTKYQSVGQDVTAKKVRILIVPGHEPMYGGTEFGSIKERDLNVELANNLAVFLSGNNKYEVFVARTSKSWNLGLDEYFSSTWDEIIDWEKSYREEMSRLIAIGQVSKLIPNFSNPDAPRDVALRLYGINKWAKEEDIDVAIHIHVNDYPRRNSRARGQYSGFAIYVPANQYLNSPATHAIADKIFSRLGKYNPVSNLPGESVGILDEPEMIAIGANNTSDAASLLIEYGYIYEYQFLNSEIRSQALKDSAYQTYLGLQDFFDPTNAVAMTRDYDTLVLPHTWTTHIREADIADQDVFALQTALLFDGFYPPAGKDKNECPRTGKIGPCTKSAVKAFQEKHGIMGGEGNVGSKTIEELNRLHGV